MIAGGNDVDIQKIQLGYQCGNEGILYRVDAELTISDDE
jgi:hypothetical protein